MIMGIGVDTVNIERFERIVAETPAFVRRVFTPNERTRNVRSQAVRFAAKEAVAKVLGAPAGLNWQDCEVATAESGQPYLIIQGTIARRAKELIAIAIATAEYLSDAELAHLQKFNPESYRLSVITGDDTDEN